MGTVGLALVAAALLVGVSTQRVIGFGFALVSGPLFVLILGALRKKREDQPPHSLGVAYFREER